METFAHFEIFDQQGNRAAEGHKVRRPFRAVLNFFSIMFPKNYNKVPKHDILGLFFAHAQHSNVCLTRVLSSRIVLICVCSVCTQTILVNAQDFWWTFKNLYALVSWLGLWPEILSSATSCAFIFSSVFSHCNTGKNEKIWIIKRIMIKYTSD